MTTFEQNGPARSPWSPKREWNYFFWIFFHKPQVLSRFVHVYLFKIDHIGTFILGSIPKNVHFLRFCWIMKLCLLDYIQRKRTMTEKRAKTMRTWWENTAWFVKGFNLSRLGIRGIVPKSQYSSKLAQIWTESKYWYLGASISLVAAQRTQPGRIRQVEPIGKENVQLNKDQHW